MAKIIVTNDGKVVQEIALGTETIIMGRKADNAIHLDSQAVSGHHARVVSIGDDFFIEDLGSTNGTFVNTEKVFQKALEDGDLITLGNFTLRFINKPGNESAAHEPPKKLNGSSSQHAHLTVLNGHEQSSKIIPIKGKIVTLGKPGEHIAAISQHSDGFFFAHVDGGDNDATTILNNTPISSEGAQLQDNDVIEVAGVKMKFHSH